MTRWIKTCCLLVLIELSGNAQSLFSYENSLQFANYLYESGQFSLASEEYERVVFLNPEDSTSIGRLLASYRLVKKPDLGLSRAYHLIGNRSNLPPGLFSQLYLLELENKRYEEAKKLISLQSGMDREVKRLADLGVLISQNNWKDAGLSYDIQSYPGEDPQCTHLGNVINEYFDARKKSPFLAASMSAIIPGAGKAYSGKWADGAIALVFIGSNAWQSYRGFEKDGIKSVRGWVFGAIGFGFWVGNIYGSYKTARQYNQNIMQQYHEKATHIIYHAF
jgi:hypothetical protein